jgi:hypothetical protein
MNIMLQQSLFPKGRANKVSSQTVKTIDPHLARVNNHPPMHELIVLSIGWAAFFSSDFNLMLLTLDFCFSQYWVPLYCPT